MNIDPYFSRPVGFSDEARHYVKQTVLASRGKSQRGVAQQLLEESFADTGHPLRGRSYGSIYGQVRRQHYYLMGGTRFEQNDIVVIKSPPQGRKVDFTPGFENTWVGSMYSAVGLRACVVKQTPQGVTLRPYERESSAIRSYRYPPSCLEKVTAHDLAIA